MVGHGLQHPSSMLQGGETKMVGPAVKRYLPRSYEKQQQHISITSIVIITIIMCIIMCGSVSTIDRTSFGTSSSTFEV